MKKTSIKRKKRQDILQKYFKNRTVDEFLIIDFDEFSETGFNIELTDLADKMFDEMKATEADIQRYLKRIVKRLMLLTTYKNVLDTSEKNE